MCVCVCVCVCVCLYNTYEIRIRHKINFKTTFNKLKFSFPSRTVVIPRLNSKFAELFSCIWRKNLWMHNFPKLVMNTVNGGKILDKI